MRLAHGSLVLLAVLCVPSPSSADDPPPAWVDLAWGEAEQGRAEALRAWASAAIFSGPLRGSNTTLVAPSLGLRLAMTDEISASANWAFAYGIANVAGVYEGASGSEPFNQAVERVEAGNPTLMFAWAPVFGDVTLRVGLGTAIPMAALSQAPSDVSSAAQRAASTAMHQAMLAMHGGRDAWRFLPERLAFFVPISLSFGTDIVAFMVEWAMGWTIPVLGGRGSHEAIVQGAGDVAVMILPELRAGIRGSVSAWGIGEGAPDPRFQPSIEPWVRVLLGMGFLTVRGTINLGGSDGFGSADSAVWAIHLGGGISLL
jgi:hypothetical protein